MTANRWASDHIADSALFRTFGLSGAEALRIFTTELVALGGLASGLGIFIGYGLQIVLVDTIAGLLTISLPEPTAKPAILGFLTGFITLFGFAAPALILLANVPPIRVLKRDYHVSGLGQFSRYGFALCAVGALGYLYSDDLLLTGWVVIAVIILVGLSGLGRIIIRSLDRWSMSAPLGVLVSNNWFEIRGSGQLMAFARAGRYGC